MTAGRTTITWGRTARWTPASLARPRDADEVVAVVRAASRDGLRVKPIGAGHSFTSIAATDGVQVDLAAVSGLVSVDAARGLATLRAGTRLRDIPALLAPHGLAMENLGDIDAQSIAGAIATGTHGTGARFGGLAAQVERLALVLADGAQVDCAADERPDLFAAARVGLGALGVVTEVTLRCVPAFLLEADERPVRLGEMLETFEERVTATDHVEFFWFPHTDWTLAKHDTRRPPEAGRAPLHRVRAWFDDEFLANDVFGALCRVGERLPGTIPTVNRIAARALGRRTYRDWSDRVFASPRRVRFREMEVAVPRATIVDVVREVRDLIDRRGWRISFPVEIRVAAADDIWLSPAQGRDTAYLAVHTYHRTPHEAYFAAVEDIVRDVGGRPHWGKLHTLTAAELAPRYPRFADFLAVRDAVDPGRRFANGYLDRVLGP